MEVNKCLKETSDQQKEVNLYFVISGNLRIKMNENTLPLDIMDHSFLYHRNMNIRNSLPYLITKLFGKWMMFFKHSDDYNKKWKDCCKLYDDGKLTGIRSLKCSTGYKNPRASDHTTGVILFYCGPMTDKTKMLEYGRNLLNYIPYYSSYGHMAYKSDEQTRQGTRATGNRNNYLYQIPVPTDPF